MSPQRSTLYIQIAICVIFVAISAYVITTKPLSVEPKSSADISEENADAIVSKSTYTDALYGFSVEYPSTWSVHQETTGDMYSVFFIAPFPLLASFKGSVAVSVTSDFFNGDIDALADVYASLATYESEYLHNKKVLWLHEKTTFLDLPAYRHITTKERFLDGVKEPITQKTEGFAFIHNSKVYVIEYRNDPIKFELMRSIGDDIIGSFRF